GALGESHALERSEPPSTMMNTLYAGRVPRAPDGSLGSMYAEADAGALLADRARRAMGSDLAGFQWDFFVTLTTRKRVTAEAIDAAMREEFVRSLARKAQRSVSYFYGIEGGEHVGGFHHVHALIFTGGRLDTRSVRRSWWRGHTDVRRYDARRGAAWYVS